jgi:hypothetical protein
MLRRSYPPTDLAKCLPSASYTKAAMLAASAVLLTQGSSTIRLSPVGVEFDHAFSSIAGIREVSDGRVLVLDELEFSVQVLDFDRGSIQQLGRTGAGPGEYGWPNQLIRFRGDSTAIRDGLHGRLLIVLPDDAAGGVATLQGRPISERFLKSPNVIATDQGGGLFGYLPVTSDRDSALILRWERTGSGLDTIARIPAPPGRMIGGAVFTERVGPYHSAGSWSVALDGRVAVLHPEPYRVDFISLDGNTVRGPPLPYRSIKLTEAHKESWRAAAKAQQVGLAVTGTRGAYISSAQKVSRPFREPASWPAYLPPFLSGAGTFSQGGDYWVRRTTSSPEIVEYDVIDSNARLKARVRLPDSTRIVGFGTTSIYVARTDEDGLQHLRRYRDPFRQ